LLRGGGGGDFHSEDFRFVQEAPCFNPCDYVIKEFVVSIAHISIRLPEMPVCISFLLGCQHSKYRTLTNTAHFQHIVQTTESPSYRNSNLWCSMVHIFPSVTSDNLSHICFIYWRWWGPLRGWSSTLASICDAFMLGMHFRFFSLLFTITLAATC
jgi:hypothetical protein